MLRDDKVRVRYFRKVIVGKCSKDPERAFAVEVMKQTYVEEFGPYGLKVHDIRKDTANIKLSGLTSAATSVMRPCIPQPAAASQIRAPCLRFLTPAAAANEPKVDKRGAVAAGNSAAKAASAAEQWTAKCAQATSAVSLDLEQSLAKTADQAQVQAKLSALEAQAQRSAPTEGQGGEVEDDEVEIFDEEDEDDDEAEAATTPLSPPSRPRRHWQHAGGTQTQRGSAPRQHMRRQPLPTSVQLNGPSPHLHRPRRHQ
eukprot:jgi/Tetstr1/458799/TSEL_045183.t1